MQNVDLYIIKHQNASNVKKVNFFQILVNSPTYTDWYNSSITKYLPGFKLTIKEYAKDNLIKKLS